VRSLSLLYPQLRGLCADDFLHADCLVIASDDVDDKDSFVLGSGSQGSVLKATLLPDEAELVAVKVGRSVSILEEYLKIRQFSHTSASKFSMVPLRRASVFRKPFEKEKCFHPKCLSKTFQTHIILIHYNPI
jgi:hypothetical protein